MGFEIDESVIEYHVPSVIKLNKKRQKHKNIKINIHINNDIIAKGDKKKKKKQQISLPPQHEKSQSFMSDHSLSHSLSHSHSKNASMGSSAIKKKKKHKHKRHRSKKNCSCQKHDCKQRKEKEIASPIPTMDRAHSSHYFSPRSKKQKKEKKEKKNKKRKKEIKFRQKAKTPKAVSSNSIRVPKGRGYKGIMSKTPKVGMPSAPIHSSPRYHRRNESVPRFDWNEVCCE